MMQSVRSAAARVVSSRRAVRTPSSLTRTAASRRARIISTTSGTSIFPQSKLLRSNPSNKLFQTNLGLVRTFSSAAQERVLGAVLSDTQEQLVREELIFLDSLLNTLQTFDASKDDVESIRTSIQQLKDLFLLVVIGEFNSGKSTFLNAMLGKKWLQDGVTPTTSQVNVLRYGSQHSERPGLRSSGDKDPNLKEVELPVDWLKQISLVDTPGTNAVIAEHQQITEHFVPRSDMVLFVTSCDRAFTESERVFLDRVREYKKKIVVILSKIDLLETEKDLQDVMAWVRDQSAKLLALEGALIFPVSSKKALKAKITANGDVKALQTNAQWVESRFGALEEYILKQLSVQERNQLKLKNPLGLAEHIVKKYVRELETRASTIEHDAAVIKRINGDIDSYKDEMFRDFKLHQERVDTVLLKMSERASEFLDETLALSNVTELLQQKKIKTDFETKVVGDAVQQIEANVALLIDWILEKNARQWTQVVDYAQRQIAVAPANQLVGSVRTQFNYNRQALLAGLGESARRVVSTFDRSAEAKKMSEQITSSLLQTVAMQLGAVTIGAMISMSLLDVTGLLGVGAFAALGVGILPYRRRQMRIALTSQIESLRKTLYDALQDQFTKELERGIDDIKANIAPYTRFVEQESKQLDISREKLQKNIKDIEQLARKVEDSFRA